MTDEPIDTMGTEIDFGKHAGLLVTRIPVSYLRWAISQDVRRPIQTRSGQFTFSEVAAAEIKRRGERMSGIEVSGHAVDRLSIKFRRTWHENNKKGEGIYSWMQRAAMEAWKKRSEETFQNRDQDGIATHVIKHLGIKWVIQEWAVPVVKTVK